MSIFDGIKKRHCMRPIVWPKPAPAVEVRPIRREDSLPISWIENATANQGGPLAAWSEHDVIEAMQAPSYGAACVSSGRVLGYVIFQPRRRSWEILRLAVDPDYRRAGLGGLLVGFVFSMVAFPPLKGPRLDRVSVRVPDRSIETLGPWLSRRWFVASHYSDDFSAVVMSREVK